MEYHDHQRNLKQLARTPFIAKLAPSFQRRLVQLFDQGQISEPYQGSSRLGFYYQWLVRQAIIASNDYDLIAEEVIIQGDKQTLGAIDFLVRDRVTSELEHWEVALKFYLQSGSQWLGPNVKDALERKYERMLSHQLRLTSTAEYQRSWGETYGLPTQHRAIIQGYLFASGEALSLAEWVNPEAIKQDWYFIQEISDQWRRIEKPDWISPPSFSDALTIDYPLQRPIQCINQQGLRGFIVPGGWPDIFLNQ
uniref:DUF1853 family protein n=1 Tax=Thaumasiovibrio occultus TaxID=1891184 RepID=UPI000B35C352|nr:DUF1853 family protein [Thaumasiovibrio occultus]